jgi:hypothetical protein
MVDEYWMGRDFEGSSHGLFEMIFQYSPSGTEETYGSLWITYVAVEIQTDYLPNTSLNCVVITTCCVRARARVCW